MNKQILLFSSRITTLPVTPSANVDGTGGVLFGRREAAVLLRVHAVGFHGAEAGARRCALLFHVRIDHLRRNVVRYRVSFTVRLVAGFSRHSCRQILRRPLLDRHLLVIRWRDLVRIAHPLRQMIVSRRTFHDTVDTLDGARPFLLVLFLRLPGGLSKMKASINNSLSLSLSLSLSRGREFLKIDSLANFPSIL